MPDDIHSYISSMLGAAHSKSGDELLVYSIDQVLRSAKPRQAEVLRRCAVPRWFDLSVLRVLRESDEDNERVLERLREYSFVRDLGDGRLAYHDQVRQALLGEWRRDRPDDLRELHRLLYNYFSQRTTPPGATTRAMPLMPESTMLSVVPMRVQADMFHREALYHLLYIEPTQGLSELRTSFAFLEEAHRLAEAEQLLQVAAEASLGPRERRWLAYMHARVLQASLRLNEAASELVVLQGRDDLEPELAADVSRTLGEVYAEIGQWARATELYRQSLSYYARNGDKRAVAETMLLLGEAYQGLGVSTGSWHVPYVPASPLLQMLHGIWVWLLGLPFQIAILLLGSRNRLLPRAEHCARYQNWLLIRLYNTSRTWFAQARDAFKRLDDSSGTLRAEQRLADILLLYGYHDEARVAIEELLERREARDPYRKAWLQRSLADCHLMAGDVGSAQVLLAEALGVFKEVGDVRREAAVLNLQGRAAMLAGDLEGALRSYTSSLERFRALRYAAARERVLHELRAWQRRPGSAALRSRIGALIAAEPEKRYVGRFIRSYLPLLQITTTSAGPLALLLMAAVAPTTAITLLNNGVLSLSIFFNPWRVLGVLLTITPIYMAVYAAMATAIIYWLPINRIEREQPDVIITRPDTIARYDSRGNQELELAWTSVRRWLALDRCVWDRPLPLYSRTYLEDEAGRDLPIDGITGWYGELQRDISRRLAAAGNTVARGDLGYKLLKSKSGVALTLGSVLLLLVTAANNGWLPLATLVPPALIALLWFVALSGVLILVPLAYWLANRPLKLQQTLLLNNRWPLFLAVVGGLPVLLYLLSGGQALSVDALNYSTFVWGAYVLAEALAFLLAPGRRQVRLVTVSMATLVALLIVALPAFSHFRWLEGYIARKQVVEGNIAAAPSCGAAGEARTFGGDPYSTYLIQGDCAAQAGNWADAAMYYARAAEAAQPNSPERALALYNLSLAAAYLGNQQSSGAAAQDYQQISDAAAQGYLQICASSPQVSPLCNQVLSTPNPADAIQR